MAQVLIDGFVTSLTFGGCTLTICAKSITPPEMDSGGSIDITPMVTGRKYRIKSPKYLINLNSMNVTAAYDPVVYSQGMVISSRAVGSNQLFVLTFPDGSTLEFWGAVEKMTFGENKEGEQPTVTLMITPTLWNGTFSAAGCPLEVSPAFTAGSQNQGNYRLCS